MPPTSRESSQGLSTETPAAVSMEFLDSTGGATIEEANDEDSSSATSVPLQSLQNESAGKTTIVLKTHDGDGYVLPHVPWNTTKLQIEEIYRLRHRENLADAVRDGKFSILDKDDNIILPSLWEQVVRPSATLQIVLPSDILNPDIASRYPNVEEATSCNSSSIILPDDHITNQEVLDVDNSIPTVDDSGSGSDEGSDLDSIGSGSEGSDSPSPVEVPDEFLRQVTVPTDGDGNGLTFRVNTAFFEPSDQATTNANANDQSNKDDSQQSAGNAEHLSIAKAVSAQCDGRTSLQIYILPGPRTTSMDADISIRWFHLQSERLDFASFKKTCLGIFGLSGRLQILVRQLFDKVEKERHKIFLGGMFIEPGTVLRADESHQTDPQSVIFSCVPYFDLQTLAKKTSASANRFTSRTLMQSYYPYEPVQDRDSEQAYRLFGNDKRDALVHVPNIWMVNIGSDIVATCGHQALSKDFVQSIEVIEASRIYRKDGKVPTTDVRLTDSDHLKLLYTLDECRSFFQMEQKLRELKWGSARSQYEGSLQLLWQMSAGYVKVVPDLWPNIISQRDALFINLSLASGGKEDDKNGARLHIPSQSGSSSIPFFHWPQSVDTEKTGADGLLSDDVKRSIQCLEYVEKAMLSEVLSSYGSYSAVEETFKTTAYYRSLPEETAEHVKASLQSLPATIENSKSSTPDNFTVHEAMVTRQQHAVARKTLELYEIMHRTLSLFVGHVDKSTMLRKSWGAMQSICEIATMTCKRPPLRDDTPLPDTAHQVGTSQGWFVRPYIDDTNMSAPFQKTKRTFERCRKCSSNEMYKTSKAALLHLNRHLGFSDPAVSGTVKPEQWIVSHSQMELEMWNEGTVKIVTAACRTARELFVQAKELSDGVRNEDGQMSTLYTFPRPLLSAFRQLLVFYFAVERSLFYTKESFEDKGKAIEMPGYISALPFSPGGIEVIETFGNGVYQALKLARADLCSMVKSTKPVEVFNRLSLSPEYVCGWLMRRLLVKPLEKSMTVSDMYREYLSTIQFQVNHRPGKRLLRSINLLQEEIAALQEVNTQQSKLISNYMSVLDDTTYEKDIPSRRATFPYERMLLESCLDSLKMTDQEYRYLLARCGPLSDSTKQSLEINEEDHGKAIMVFTIVTVIFLPLSFVTSFLGMNTTDIRDMGSSSTLFWAIAIPLTAVTMGSVLYIGYNGDDLRDTFSSLYRKVAGKQDSSIGARGISVAQRKLARKSATGSSSTLDFSSLADEAEFANPRPEDPYNSTWRDASRHPRRQLTLEPPTMHWEPYTGAANPVIPELRTGLRRDPLQDYYFDRRDRHGRRTSEYREPETLYTRARPNATIYNTNHMDDEPVVQTYNETIIADGRRARRRYSPPPPPPPPPRTRTQSDKPDEQDDWYTKRQPTERSQVRQYEWTKRSHRHHQSTREETRHRRNDHNGWYEARPIGPRHIPAPRYQYERKNSLP